MKSDRLLSVLLLLQARGRVTERELAERLEVSQRTVHRDMEALSAARVPVSAIRGSQGGWELERGWRTQVPALDEAELRALLMAQPRAIGHSRLAAAAESALNKLMAALPGPMRTRAAAMRERLHVDPTGWRGTSEDLSMLAAVQEAVAGDRKLAFDYTRADGQKGPRTVEPLGVVAKGLTWYLVARGSSGMRTYRVSRMSNVTLLAATFERPAQFDLEAYWKDSTARLSEQRGGFEVTLCVSPQAAQRLTEWGAVRPAQEVRPGPDGSASGDLTSSDADGKLAGWEKLTASFDNEGEAQFVVMGLGSRARVMSPEGFRRRIAEEMEATAGLAGAGLQIKDKLA
jgi:predicted DNA-binding transcriptional regulator YafY